MRLIILGNETENLSREEALADVKSAIRFHVETFGPEVMDDGETPLVGAFVAEASVEF